MSVFGKLDLGYADGRRGLKVLLLPQEVQPGIRSLYGTMHWIASHGYLIWRGWKFVHGNLHCFTARISGRPVSPIM